MVCNDSCGRVAVRMAEGRIASSKEFDITERDFIDLFQNSAHRGIFVRVLAIAVVDSVISKNRLFEKSFKAICLPYDLTPTDYHFIRMLSLTCLRQYGFIRHVTDQLVRYKPKYKYIDFVMRVLEMGLTQIFFLKVKPYAITSTAVKIIEILDNKKVSGFTNAVLRNALRNIDTIRCDEKEQAYLNTPSWLWDIWLNHYGKESAERIALAHQAPPPLSIAVKGDISHWAEKLDAHHLFKNILVRKNHSGSVKLLPGYEEGEWWIQDPAASLPALLFDSLEGKTVLDLCAAPGGKTLQMAHMGAHIIAVDQNINRLAQMQKNIERLDMTKQVDIVQADILTSDFDNKKFSSILLDAPCSSTGTIRRHSDILFLKTAKDIDHLIPLQRTMLEKAWSLLEVDGKLVFSVCSLDPREGLDQMRSFLDDHHDASLYTPDYDDQWDGGVDSLNKQGFIQTFPYFLQDHGGMDGFFACAFIKSPS